MEVRVPAVGVRRSDPPVPNEEITRVLSRRPAIGLALGVLSNGRVYFRGQGVANTESGAPITEHTVFRIASITKLFTAIAIMQLWERGLVDLDAPAGDYLSSYRLVPAHPGLQPPSLRHLLTHTSGIPDVRSMRDVLHPSWGPFDARPAAFSVPVGDPLPTLAEYYRRGLRFEADPGTAFTYSNHGFATVGQIVEEVSGLPIERYFDEYIFGPLGMRQSNFSRPGHSDLATGYVLGRRGATPVADRDWITMGASGVYSTTYDLSRFVAALLAGGRNDEGSILAPQTLAMMFAPHYQSDPRLPGMGLGFFRDLAGSHATVGHDGRMPGFNSQILLAPDAGVGVIGLVTGSRRAMFWLPKELARILDSLLGVPERAARAEIPQHPEIWSDLCGRYHPRAMDLRGRMMVGIGLDVLVGGDGLVIRFAAPVPALYRGVPLYPDDPSDPYVFAIDLSRFGMPVARAVFSRSGERVTAVHIDLGLLSFYKQPVSGPRRRRRARVREEGSAVGRAGR